jgi:ORF6N domain
MVPESRIARHIAFVRGHKVMLDRDLAVLYRVSTKQLNQQVQRNGDRFPSDFMFQLTTEETDSLRSQFAISNMEWGGRRSLPHALTEQGVAMLSGVLKSRRAVLVNVEIMRTFVKLRQILSTHAEPASKLEELETKYDSQFRVVFDAVRELMNAGPGEGRPVGFRP